MQFVYIVYEVVGCWKYIEMKLHTTCFYHIYSFFKKTKRDTPCALAHIESQVKSKTVMSWSLQKKKENTFCTIYFVWRKFFKHICFLSQCLWYYMHVHNIHTFTYQKTLLHTLFSLFLKSLKAFSVSLKQSITYRAFPTWEIGESLRMNQQSLSPHGTIPPSKLPYQFFIFLPK